MVPGRDVRGTPDRDAARRERRQRRPSGSTPLANHSAFAIDDYAATLARLKARRVEVLETNAERGQLWVRDPDGNVLELIVAAARA